MLTITATNFGVSPASIQIQEFHAQNLLILSGEFTVDATDATYLAARRMILTVADLPFNKSRRTTAFVTAVSDGTKYISVTKCWISDKNTINIAKVSEYKALGSYKVKFSTVFIPTMITGPVSLSQGKSYVPVVSKGAASNLEVRTVEASGWLMLMMRASALTFDSESDTVEMTLPDFPSGVSFDVPIIYNESLYSELGSKYYPATLQNGVLTIAKDGAADEPSTTEYKFTRIIVVR